MIDTRAVADAIERARPHGFRPFEERTGNTNAELSRLILLKRGWHLVIEQRGYMSLNQSPQMREMLNRFEAGESSFGSWTAFYCSDGFVFAFEHETDAVAFRLTVE